jgi:hypothetical protein
MTIREQINNVLSDCDLSGFGTPEGQTVPTDGLVIEEQGDGIAAVRLQPITSGAMAVPARTDALGHPVLQSCANLFADAGFVVALLKDDRGAFVSVR